MLTYVPKKLGVDIQRYAYAHRYHDGDPVFINAQVCKPTKKNLSTENGTMVWQLGFLCDVPGGVSGGVFVNDEGEAVGCLSHRSEQDKMTYAICLSCKASKDFFDQVLQQNALIPESTESDAQTSAACVSRIDMRVIKQAAAIIKKSMDPKIDATNECHRKPICCIFHMYNRHN